MKSSSRLNSEPFHINSFCYEYYYELTDLTNFKQDIVQFVGIVVYGLCCASVWTFTPSSPLSVSLSSSSVTSASLHPTRRTPGWWDLWWRPGIGATGTMRRDSRRLAPLSLRATRRARRCVCRAFARARVTSEQTHTEDCWSVFKPPDMLHHQLGQGHNRS